jgi:hypothetical protein
MLSINPEAARPQDVARMAAQWMDYRHELERLRDVVCEQDTAIIQSLLEDDA